jgi:hypothetical protein
MLADVALEGEDADGGGRHGVIVVTAPAGCVGAPVLR